RSFSLALDPRLWTLDSRQKRTESAHEAARTGNGSHGKVRTGRRLLVVHAGGQPLQAESGKTVAAIDGRGGPGGRGVGRLGLVSHGAGRLVAAGEVRCHGRGGGGWCVVLLPDRELSAVCGFSDRRGRGNGEGVVA